MTFERSYRGNAFSIPKNFLLEKHGQWFVSSEIDVNSTIKINSERVFGINTWITWGKILHTAWKIQEKISSQRVICRKEFHSKLKWPVCWITNWSGWFCSEDETFNTSDVLLQSKSAYLKMQLVSKFQINPYFKLCLAETDWHWKASCHRFRQGVCFLYCEKLLSQFMEILRSFTHVLASVLVERKAL